MLSNYNKAVMKNFFKLFQRGSIDKYTNVSANSVLTDADLASTKFKIQYLIKDSASIPLAIRQNVRDAVDKVEKIITHTTPQNYVFDNSDSRIPYTYTDSQGHQQRLIKDIFVEIQLSAGIPEESGAASDDTIGGTQLVETKRIRTNDGLKIYPVYSIIQLDKETALSDIKSKFSVRDTVKPKFYFVFLHELLHALGFGFLWTDPDYDPSMSLDEYDRYWIKDPESSNPLFVGPKLAKYGGICASAVKYGEFVGLPGRFHSVPIENDGEGGSRLWHWEMGYYKDDDGVLVSKAGRTINGIPSPGLYFDIGVAWGIDVAPALTPVTIANLEDLGYLVNYAEADVNSLREMYQIAPPPDLADKLPELPALLAPTIIKSVVQQPQPMVVQQPQPVVVQQPQPVVVQQPQPMVVQQPQPMVVQQPQPVVVQQPQPMVVQQPQPVVVQQPRKVVVQQPQPVVVQQPRKVVDMRRVRRMKWIRSALIAMVLIISVMIILGLL